MEIGILVEKDKIFPLRSQILEFYPVVLVAIVEWDVGYTRREDIVQTAISDAWNSHHIPTLTLQNLPEIRVEGLLRGNYDIVDALNADCGYIIVGKVFIDIARMSLNSRVYQAKANCTLKLIDAVARREIWSKSIDSQYSMDTLQNGAGRKAKIKLGNQINVLIEDFLTKLGE